MSCRGTKTTHWGICLAVMLFFANVDAVSSRPISLKRQSVDVRDLLTEIAHDQQHSLIVERTVQGKVSIDFHGIEWDEAIAEIARCLSVEFRLDSEVDAAIVAPIWALEMGLHTHRTREFVMQYAQAGEVARRVQKLLSGTMRRTLDAEPVVKVDEKRGVVYVSVRSGNRRAISAVEELVERIDNESAPKGTRRRISIHRQDADLRGLLFDLARQAGIELRLSESIGGWCVVNIESSDAVAALEQVLEDNDLCMEPITDDRGPKVVVPKADVELRGATIGLHRYKLNDAKCDLLAPVLRARFHDWSRLKGLDDAKGASVTVVCDGSALDIRVLGVAAGSVLKRVRHFIRRSERAR